MKVVIAPDSFKGSLSAPEVCTIIGKAFSNVAPDTVVSEVPMADGGEGTLEALVRATNGRKVPVTVQGPLQVPVETCYGVLGDGKTAVIEMAQIAGLPMVDEADRNPLLTSTYGVGQVLKIALDAGHRDFIVGVGGSATNDGGLGFLQALGARCVDAADKEVNPVGGSLATIESVDFRELDERLKTCRISIASDVENPLCGEHGASAVFGPQKGATPDMVRHLDAGLQKFAALVEAELGQSFKDKPGAGAAGGLGFGLLCINSQFESGAGLVAKAARLEDQLEAADYVITGEGKTDEQTLFGKVPYVVAQIAHQHGVKTLLLSGSLADDIDGLESLFVSLHSILSRPMTTAEAIANAESLLYKAARNLARLLGLTRQQR